MTTLNRSEIEIVEKEKKNAEKRGGRFLKKIEGERKRVWRFSV